MLEVSGTKTDDLMAVTIGDLRFVWEGGMYIDILIQSKLDELFYSAECINVKDREGNLLIAFEYSAFMRRCIEWFEERV